MPDNHVICVCVCRISAPSSSARVVHSSSSRAASRRAGRGKSQPNWDQSATTRAQRKELRSAVCHGRASGHASPAPFTAFYLNESHIARHRQSPPPVASRVERGRETFDANVEYQASCKSLGGRLSDRVRAVATGVVPDRCRCNPERRTQTN